MASVDALPPEDRAEVSPDWIARVKKTKAGDSWSLGYTVIERESKASAHMPRWASRLTLELTGLRVERLQDISEADAIAEGIEPVRNERGGIACWKSCDRTEIVHLIDPVNSYETLWESLHGEGSWDASPWVWTLTFRVHQLNVDAFLARRAA